jgi:hypothetical protein
MNQFRRTDDLNAVGLGATPPPTALKAAPIGIPPSLSEGNA